jgi:hypothetical protein
MTDELVSDDEEQIHELVQAARDTGAAVYRVDASRTDEFLDVRIRAEYERDE